MLNDSSRDQESTGTATTGNVGSGGSFVPQPVCEGVANSFESNDGGNFSTVSRGFQITNTNDINGIANIYQERSIIVWCSASDVSVPTCIYEQGGAVNNFAINIGIAQAITAQAADSGEPFLIAQSQFLAQANRAYFVVHIWQRHTQHSGVGNRVLLYINGVFQQETQFTGTNAFPAHAGDVVIGNSIDNLQSYNGSTQRFVARTKRCNMLGLFNDRSLTAAECREIFERSVIPVVEIAAATVASQQDALDLLIGTIYSGVNCAIRIVQATDATDYRLILDGIIFFEDTTLRDIAIQFVGPGILTLENANGSNAVEISTPPEIDLDGIAILPGGGSIVVVDNILRVDAPGVVTGAGAKLVITSPGTYFLDNTAIPVIENYSGAGVVVELINGAQVPSTLLETDGVILLVLQPFTIALTGIEPGSSVLIADQAKSRLLFAADQSGDFSYSGPQGYAGDLYYVVSKVGWSKVSGRIVVDSAVATTAVIPLAQLEQFDTDGLPQYNGGLTSSNLNFSYSAGKITGSLTADVTARLFYDEFQLFLESEDGCRWLIDNSDMQLLTAGAGKKQIIYARNINVVNGNQAGTQVLQAEIITQESPFDVSLLGSVQFQGTVATAKPTVTIG